MASYTQHDRQMEIHTPLGDDALLLTGFEGAEEFNKLFHYRLQLLSTNDSISAKDIIGKQVSFSITLRDKAPKYFNGYVARFSFKGKDDRLSSYVAEIVPWTWFLTQTKDCRMFQDKTVPQIIQEIFGDFSMAKFEIAEIRGIHEKWDYCVQYRESDFDFICRLMEQEGIYFYFRHEDGKHTMVMGDSARGYKDAEEKEASLTANFSGGLSADNLLDWERVYEFRPAKFSHADYNFEHPSASMEAKAAAKHDAPDTDKFEIFEYPGDYETKAQGEADARIRVEEIAAGTDVVHGKSVNASWGPGRKFKVEQHHVASEEGNEYVICSVSHRVKLTGDYHGSPTAELEYINTFTAISAQKTFRPERVTPKPFVRGCQTAMVVGPPGEAIHIDEYGRVKVHFYWDRRSKKDDTSSCWIRVSQNSGGGGWGGSFNPHAGHEVIVSFMEGDPDRPIITGRVYNAERSNPMSVAKKTQTLMRDHGGSEINMEGAAGAQRLTLYSPHDSTKFSLGAPNSPISGIFGETLGHMSLSIGLNETVTVFGTRQHTITLDNTETNLSTKNVNVAINYNETITGCREETVGISKTVTIEGHLTELVVGNHTHTVGAKLIQAIEGSHIHGVAGELAQTIGGDHVHKVVGKLAQHVTGAHTLDVTGEMTQNVKGKLTIDGKDEITIVAANKITLKCGPSTIELDKDGNIKIDGKIIHIAATSEMTLHAKEKMDVDAKEIKADAEKLKLSSDEFSLSASGKGEISTGSTLTVKGSTIDLNP